MIRHFFTIAYRMAMRHLNYTLINILGLAIGMACFMLIMIYVSDELSYDNFHEDSANIYRVNRLYNSNDINEDAATLSFPCGPALLMDYPDMIHSFARLFDFQVSKLLVENRDGEVVDKSFNEEWFYLGDSNITDIFYFEFLEGDKERPLDQPGSLIISESAAQRWFGDESALGKLLRVENFLEYEITAVFKDIPAQSHLKIELLGSLSSLKEIFPNHQLPDNWIWNPCWTYIRLKDNVNPKDLELNFEKFYRAHYPNFQNQEIQLYLQNLRDIHLHSHHDYEMRQNSNIVFVRILSIIALLVLILACVNFTNLSTAGSSVRVREIGVKRILGAGRSHLIRQFLCEALVMTIIAYFMASIIVELLLPAFNNFSGKSFSTGILFQASYLLFSVLLILATAILSGSYPAFYLSLLSSERNNVFANHGKSSLLARKVLVVFQFSVSIAMIIATITVYNQMKLLSSAELGFNRENVIVIPAHGNVARHYESFTGELRKNAGIKNVTGMEDIFGYNHNTRPFFVEGLDQSEPYYFPAFVVRHDFVETFEIEIVEGRSFSRDFPSDTVLAIMINERMAANMGWSNKEAIGKEIRSDREEKVIGVFKDFNAQSLHNPKSNFILDMYADENAAITQTRFIAIRLENENYSEVLEYLEKMWYKYDPARPFEYFFLDEKLDSMYGNEYKFSKLSLILTILAIVIAGMGLIGMTSFLVERKTKEICIRKINGANIGNIHFLLSREYILLIIIAILIGGPASYLVTKGWLNSFSQHVNVEGYVFVVSGLLAIGLALIIITYHSIRAFMISPADTLRYE